MSTVTMEPLARLAIGADGHGRIKSNLVDEAQESAFAADLSAHISQITAPHTADCMDDRPTIELGDGTTDQKILDSRVAWQLPGGLGLATTKAAVAANAAYLRDARDFQQAYEITSNLLTQLGYEDGGHRACGASALVEKSVSEPVAKDILIPTIEAIVSINQQLPDYLDTSALQRLHDDIDQNKSRKLQDGFYSKWAPSWHEDYLSQKFPQNFSILQSMDDEVHGHHADGVGLSGLDVRGVGFAKNAFYRATGRMAFFITEEPAAEVAFKLGGSNEERARILLGFLDDIPNVSAHLLAPGMPAFKAVV